MTWIWYRCLFEMATNVWMYVRYVPHCLLLPSCVWEMSLLFRKHQTHARHPKTTHNHTNSMLEPIACEHEHTRKIWKQKDREKMCVSGMYIYKMSIRFVSNEFSNVFIYNIYLSSVHLAVTLKRVACFHHWCGWIEMQFIREIIVTSQLSCSFNASTTTTKTAAAASN